ncbi:MAG: tyrosine-type recombinase/integrase [Nitrospiraceae bacterium]
MTSGHTFVSWFIMHGVPLATVSNLLGHTSQTMTLRYAHLSPKHLASAVRVLDTSDQSPACTLENTAKPTLEEALK